VQTNEPQSPNEFLDSFWILFLTVFKHFILVILGIVNLSIYVFYFGFSWALRASAVAYNYFFEWLPETPSVFKFERPQQSWFAIKKED
jgi:hypothetical protein